MATGDETQFGPKPELPPQRSSGTARPDPSPSLFDPNRPVAGRPQILAPQANEWDSAHQEPEHVRRRGPGGPILLFLLAGLVVAVVALGAAAWSVFGGGGGSDGEVADGQTVGDGTGEEVADPTDSTLDPTPTTEPAAPVDPNALQVSLADDSFLCDGETREFGQITGADPNEEVSFTSPQVESLRPGSADATGSLPIRWSCTPDQAGTTWELTATGVTSSRTVTFLFAGVSEPADDATAAPGEDTTAPATGQPAEEMVVEIVEDPFVCDGTVRVFGELTGADPTEEVAFTSPQASDISSGTADDTGALSIRWSCSPDQAGTTWELVATGVTSGRTASFSFTGS